MLKNKFKIILVMVISLVITSGLSVCATYNYFAKDVSYTKSDGTEINVEQALNDLYDKTKNYIKPSGEKEINVTENGSITEDISQFATVKINTQISSGVSGTFTKLAEFTGTTITQTYTVDDDYKYIFISGEAQNNYNNDNAGIVITISGENARELFKYQKVTSYNWYNRLTFAGYENIKTNDTISIYLGYGGQAVIYGLK